MAESALCHVEVEDDFTFGPCTCDQAAMGILKSGYRGGNANAVVCSDGDTDKVIPPSFYCCTTFRARAEESVHGWTCSIGVLECHPLGAREVMWVQRLVALWVRGNESRTFELAGVSQYKGSLHYFFVKSAFEPYPLVLVIDDGQENTSRHFDMSLFRCSRGSPKRRDGAPEFQLVLNVHADSHFSSADHSGEEYRLDFQEVKNGSANRIRVFSREYHEESAQEDLRRSDFTWSDSEKKYVEGPEVRISHRSLLHRPPRAVDPG